MRSVGVLRIQFPLGGFFLAVPSRASVGIAGLRYSGLRIRDAFELVFRVPWLGELLPQDLVDRISFVASGRQSDIKFAGRKQQKIQQHTNPPLPHAISS